MTNDKIAQITTVSHIAATAVRRCLDAANSTSCAVTTVTVIVYVNLHGDKMNSDRLSATTRIHY